MDALGFRVRPATLSRVALRGPTYEQVSRLWTAFGIHPSKVTALYRAIYSIASALLFRVSRLATRPPENGWAL